MGNLEINRRSASPDVYLGCSTRPRKVPPTSVRTSQTQSVEVEVKTMPMEEPGSGNHGNGGRTDDEKNQNSTSGEAAQAGASSESSPAASESEVAQAETNPVIKTVVALTDANMTTYQRLNNHEICGTNLEVKIPAIPSEAVQYKRRDTFWNVPYPGCFRSQEEHRGNPYGFIEINPFTIRPFQTINSRHSMFLCVLKGTVILKTNAIEVQEINGVRAPVLKSLTFQKHEVMIIPGDIPYSLENRTDEVVRISYNIAPEKLHESDSGV